MADEGKTNKRKRRYLPYNKPVNKGSYPLRPGVEGFFITCDGGREQKASREAINLIDSFYEDLIRGNDVGNPAVLPNKPLNKKIKFSTSDSSSSDESKEELLEESSKCPKNKDSLPYQVDEQSNQISREETKNDSKDHDKNYGHCVNRAEEGLTEKQCLQTDCSKPEEKSIDKVIDDEIAELGDKSRMHFVSLDTGCNGVSFVQMQRRSGGVRPKDIVQRLMSSAASTRKHMSRFILRLLPVEVTCYASEEDISRAVKPVIEDYFPVECQTPLKFAVLYDARANAGVERMKIINAVAKAVPAPHKVDLNHPDKTIVVQIVKTVCLIGVVEKYKELGKFNLRQLTSPRQ